MLILAITSIAIFWSALGHDFLQNWDDIKYVVENPIIRGLTVENLITAFKTSVLWNYAPIHMVSYMLDYEIWGLRAFGFIFTNLLLHAANGILFYLLLRRLVGEKVWVFLTSLIFILHPVQVESVVWVSQRKNVLAMFFFLIGFYLYSLYREREEKVDIRLYLLSLFAFTLSLLSKSITVVFPVVLLVFDLCFRNKNDVKTFILDKIPFLTIALIVGFVAIETQSADYQGGRTSYHGGSLYATLLTMLPVLVRYLTMVVWPANLSAYYNPPIKTQIDSEVAWAAVLLVFLCFIGVMLSRRNRQMFFWFAFFFICLIPVSQIIPIVTLMNDRYLYFPMLGAAVFLGSGLFRDVTWAELFSSKRYLPAAMCSILTIGTCSAVTLHRIPFWQNSFTLWSDAVKKAPNVAVTHEGFGEGLLDQGRIDEAITEFKIALNFRPSITSQNIDSSTRHALATTYNDLGAAYGMKGMTDAAFEHFTIAVQMNPLNDKAYFNLGNALVHKGLMFQALRCFETAIRLNPHNPQYYANLMQTKEFIRSGNFQSSSGRADGGSSGK